MLEARLPLLLLFPLLLEVGENPAFSPAEDEDTDEVWDCMRAAPNSPPEDLRSRTVTGCKLLGNTPPPADSSLVVRQNPPPLPLLLWWLLLLLPLKDSFCRLPFKPLPFPLKLELWWRPWFPPPPPPPLSRRVFKARRR